MIITTVLKVSKRMLVENSKSYHSVSLKQGYRHLAKDIMTSVHFKQIRSAFFPESESIDRGDKCSTMVIC